MVYESRISGESKMRTPDRVLKLEIIDGTKPKTTLGTIDPALFNGNNRLHAVMDLETSLWSMKYDNGNIPEVLKGQFTSFNRLKEHAEKYFRNRNIRITEVKD